jgi:hypothetical protein
MTSRGAVCALSFAVCAFGAPSMAQVPTSPPAGEAKQPVERLGPDLYRVGAIRVDTAKREISVAASVNQVTVLEFIANARGGMKAYETALTLDTDAINFNVALVLIGLDKSHAKPAKQHFDPNPVSGDPVEVTIEWQAGGKKERAPIETLLVNRSTNETLPAGEWVYTGSTFTEDGRYLAAVEGTLIGFAHTPSSIIESARGVGLGNYGSIVLNPKLPVSPGSKLVLHVRSLVPAPTPRSPAGRRR